MNRTQRIVGGYSIAACLMLLLVSCAAMQGPRITVEDARSSLLSQYPALLRSFDLHQGSFSVSSAEWDSLTPQDRGEFLIRCSQSRRDLTGRGSVTVRAEDEVVATYDGATPVLYNNPLLAADREANRAPGVLTTPAGADAVPVLLSLPRPVYPEDALRAGIEGTVVIQALIESDGRAHEIRVVDGGILLLNDAAVAVARNALFRPAQRGGDVVAIWVRIPVRFSVAGGKPSYVNPSEMGAGGSVPGLEVTAVETSPAEPTRK